jgi:hypothetical protein
MDMKLRRWLFIILVGIVALGIVYVFCIPCQFLGWMPMPNMSDVLTNSLTKPVHLVEISTQDISVKKLLCVHISKAALVKKTGHPSGMMADLPSQLVSIQESFEKSFKFFIDGWQKPVGNIAFSDVGPFIKCVDMADANQDQHIAHIQYNDVDRVPHSYTWMFEVKADGIVPEVTATP